MISQNGAIFSMLSILKALSFSLVAEALTGLIYHRPAGESSGFSQSYFLFHALLLFFMKYCHKLCIQRMVIR